jgi:hypothetical protein
MKYPLPPAIQEDKIENEDNRVVYIIVASYEDFI